MASPMPDRRSRVVRMLWLALIYLVATRLAVALAEFDRNTAAVWLPAGIGFAALTLHGLALWPAVLVGAFLGVVSPTTPMAGALLMTLGNTVVAVLSAWLVRNVFAFRADALRVRDVLVIFIPVALGVSVVSAVVGTAALLVSGWATWDDALPRGVLWWLGDAIGLVIAGPLILAWRARGGAMTIADVVLALPCSLAAATFALPPPHTWVHDVLVLAIFPAAVWSALQSSLRGATLANFLIAGFAVVGTTFETGPFTQPGLYSSIVQQGYTYALSLIFLVLAAARADQLESSLDLRDSESRFRGLVRLSSDWYWEQDAEFRFVELSMAPDAEGGMAALEYHGKRLWDVPAFNFGETQWVQHRAVLASHQPFRDLMVEREDAKGVRQYFSISGEPLFDDAGTFLGYRGVGRNLTRQRIAEVAQHISEERFRSLWETTTDMVLIIDRKGVIRFANPATREALGYSPEELVGSPLSLIQPEHLRDAHNEGMHHYLDTGERRIDWRGTELEARRRDGTVFPVEIVFSEIPVEGGRGFVGFLRDITKRKQAERDLRQSQTMFSTLFEASPIPIVFSRLTDGQFIAANQACLELFGFGRDQVIGKTTLQLNIWPDSAGRTALIERLTTEGRVERMPLRLRRSDGVELDVLYSAQAVDYAGANSIVATIIDISAGKRAEFERQQSEERFARIFNASPDAIVISRLSDGTYLEANEAWAQLCGYPREEMIGRSALSLGIWCIPAQREQMIEALRVKGAVRDFGFTLRCKDGTIAETLLSGEILELHGEPCLLSILTDVTERNRIDRQLRLSEQRFADVVEAAGEYVWETDIEGRFTYLSARIERVLGYKPTEMIGKTFYDYTTEEETQRLEDWFDARPDPGTPIRNLEFVSTTKSGHTIWQQVSGVPVFGVDGKRTGFRGTGLDITERKLAEQRIEELATRDALTQLPNRRLLSDRLSQAILSAQRSGGLVAVLFVDLDRFKTINDSLGHSVGDELLRGVAARLQALMRKGDTLARIGGDEFVIVVEGLRVAEDAGAVAQKVIATLSEPHQIDGKNLTTAASVGISIYPSDATDGATLIRNADMAMYFAKEQGRRNYKFYSAAMNARAVEKLTLENTLREALKLQQFELHYHPIFAMGDDRLVGAEALIRWRHPELGMVPPGQFVPICEESGLIVPIGHWVLESACSQAASWARSFGGEFKVAVNLSVGQFDKSLARTVHDVLGRSGLDAGRLELEITESMLMQNAAETIEALRQLSQLGVRLAIDDFGTGYSSLAYLRRFQVDTLKIDQSFVREIENSLDAAAIVEAIVALGHTLNLEVIAEGVETEEQRQRLSGIGCDAYQGFLRSEPLCAADFEARFLAARR